MQLRLDSLPYRFFWRLKRILYFKNAGPRPIKWLKSCHQFQPPPNFQQTLDLKGCRNFETLIKELEILTKISAYLPRTLTEKDWSKLCQLETSKERFEYLIFLNKRGKRRAFEKQKDEIRKELVEQKRMKLAAQKATMDEQPQKLLLQTGSAEIERKQHQLSGQRCVHAFQFIDEYPRLIVDCRWLLLHSDRGMNLAAKQLNCLLALNREREQPWPVILANFLEGNQKLEAIKERHLKILSSENSFVANVTAQSYLDLYPELRANQKIVYLSPHSKEPLETVEAGTCYVISGIVDRIKEPAIPSKASLLTAEEEQLPCKKLPISLAMLKGGSSLLTFDQVMLILQEKFDSPNLSWQPAIERYLPKRKMTARTDKNLGMQQKYTNIAIRNREILRIMEEKIAQQEIEHQIPFYRKIPTFASFGQFLRRIRPTQLQQRNYSTLPTEKCQNERPIPQRQQIEEAIQREDWTIRRQPTRPKSALSRKQREQQYREQLYTHIYPMIGLKVSEKERKLLQVLFALWIFIDLVILGKIWWLEGQKDIDPEKKHKKLTKLLAIFFFQNIFFIILNRLRAGIKLNEQQMTKNGKISRK